MTKSECRLCECFIAQGRGGWCAYADQRLSEIDECPLPDEDPEDPDGPWEDVCPLCGGQFDCMRICEECGYQDE